ncbi:(d)CMP kinase [Demequina pelophila]|uniref:(d)CMP kinase n=1 Tax=Demequina pelophila TaxID=1638984 RepID=UPI000B0EF083|nr:(d)CMP kinase [Demequina pelophila]
MLNAGVSEMIARVRASAPRLGRTRLVLVDGPAGSGKTTLGERLGAALGAQVLHADDMYEGWDGLATLDRVLVDGVLEPLSRRRPGTFRRWDWLSSARAEEVRVPVADALVVEGVGVASRAAREHASLVVFVEAPWPLRRARGVERDGEAMAPEWDRWHGVEDAHLAAEGTRAAAHVLVDGAARVPD